MKQRLHLIILLASIALSGMAQTIGDAFYIYRNDGQFNAFFRDEVDSIAYSYYDADSVYYDEVVTQIVYTTDSIYKIPLAAIDSVGFVQMEKEYQPELMRMDESWLPYVVGITDNSIKFKSSTPKAFLPEIGQVIVAETYESPFETGFAGRVSRRTQYVDWIEYQVDAVSLSDIYRQLVTVGFSSSEPEDNATVGAKGLNVYEISPAGGIRFPLPDIELSLGAVSFSCKPNIVLKYIICIMEHNMKNYADVMVHQTYEGAAAIDCKIDGSYTPEPKWSPASIPITTGVPGLYGAIRYGLFFRASGEVALSATQPFTVSGVTGFTYTEEKGIQGINKWSAAMHDTEISLGLDGSVSTGLAVRLEFGVISKRIASADVTAYVGPKFSGDFSLTTQGLSGGGLYSSIKDSEATLSLNAEVVPGYQCVINKWIGDVPHPEDHQELPVSLNFGYDLNHWYIVPEFKNLRWTPNDDTRSGTLSGNISRNLLPKVSLGWGLYDENDKLYKSYYFPATYRKIKDWRNNGLTYSVAALPAGGHYTAYPLVSLMGVEMRADEGVEISADPMAYNGQVTKKSVTSATVTGSVEGISRGTVVDAGICYSNNPNAQNWNYASANKKTDGDFSVEIKGLSPKTKYYYCAYAYKDGEYYYADELMEFTTSSDASIVQITGFEQTGSKYSPNAYSYNGSTYSYKYDVATTVTLQDNTDVEDWGYVYTDPDGNTARISLMSYSSPYTDTSHPCYRNSDNSTVTLYGYVKFVEISEYYYGGAKSYTLKHLPADPLVYNGQITKKSAICATVTGSVEGLTQGAVVDAGICYSDNPNAQNWNYASANKKTDGDFSVEIKGLSPKTKYYCCAYAYKDGEYYYVDELMEFTTSSTASIVQITDFEQIGSKYSQNAYSYNGNTYSYKYDVATTVTLQDNTDVEDWGYVYKDPDGNTARISLMSYTSPYTDTRYAYYRNSANSTVMLYGYVKFAGDSEYYYGDTKSYSLTHKGDTTCPDGNHPHYIDLGLPSGTKWCCCNVGASSPEQRGSYLTFDEAQGYNPPSLDQIKELVNNTSYQWTTQNGVNGGKFTGPNGGSVFLPGAGSRHYSGGKFSYVGSDGNYWSSTPLFEYLGYGLYCYFVRACWGHGRREYGRSVRPVR